MRQTMPKRVQADLERLAKTNDTVIFGDYVEDDQFDYLDSKFVADFSSSIDPYTRGMANGKTGPVVGY